MSVDEYNEDEFEEVEEEEQEKDQLPLPVPQPIPVQQQQQQQPTTEEQVDEAFKRPNNLFAVNHKRNIDKKANSIRFFLHFALNKHKPYGDVAKEVGITKAAASKYIDEYASVVINSIEAGTFPDGVLVYYNDASMPKAQRLTARHVQELKSILLRYKKINVDSMLGEGQEIEEEEEEEEEQNEDNNILDDIFKPIEKTTAQSKGQFKKYNEFAEAKNTVNTNPRVINENSPIQDVIEFGLINAGANDAAKIRRIKTLFMSSPNFYLADEGRFKDLLLSNLINEKTLNTFLDWFKYVSPIKGTERVGFLNLTKSSVTGNQMMGQQQQGQGQQQGKSFNNFSIDDYDEFAQFLYHEGVFRYGYPPNHPINQENYKEYQDKKKMEKEEQQTMRQFNLMTKKMLMDMQAKAMGLGGTSQQVSSPGIAFDERLLFERGIVAPEITYTEDGKRIVKWIPTGRSPYDAQAQQQQQQPANSLNDSVNMFSRLVEALRPIFLQNAAPAGQQNPLMDKMLTILLEKSLNKVEETPSKVLENQMNLFSQFKQFFPQSDNTKVDPATMQLQLELAKIQQDGKMAEREIEIKEKMWSLEQQRLEEQKHESKDNITMIMEYVQKGIGFLGPVLQSLLMGQMGGGLSNMMGNMMGGGNNNGMADMMQQQQSPFIPQDSGMSFEEPSGGIPPNIPPEFLPQEEPSPVFQQEPQFVPQQQFVPEQQLQQQQEQFIPQQQQQSPTVQEENNFLDSVTPDDLSSLDLNQLHDIESRIDSKIRKLEKVYNNIKSTKAKKEFGFTNVDKYSVLDVPSTIPDDYDGLKEETPPPPPTIQFPEQNEFPTLDNVQEEQNQDPFDAQIINDNYNNDIYKIMDMGNDNQQFNQQNNVNQKEYIDEQAKKEQDRNNAQKLAHLQSIGCSDANINNLHLYDDNGNLVKTIDTSTSTDALNDSASPTNRDTFNQNPDLNDSKTGPSEEFQKQQQKHQQQNNNKQVNDKQAHENRENAREEQQNRWQTSESVTGNTNDNKAETNYTTTNATVDNTHNKDFGQKATNADNKKDNDKKEINKKSTTTSTSTVKNKKD